MDIKKTIVKTANYAFAEDSDGKWAVVVTAANEVDAQIGGHLFMTEFMNTKEEAEVKLQKMCEMFAQMGLTIKPMKPPA